MADPDDWFADVEPARTPREAPVERRDETPSPPRDQADEEWADIEPADGLLQTVAEWRVVIGLVVLAVAVLAALAVAGVFSAGKHPAAVTTPPTTPHTTPAHTTSTGTTTTGTTTGTTGTTTTSGPTTTLKPGDTGAQVKALQRSLASLGYTVGKIDGDYGTGTKTALEQFQTASNLTADGVFGPATRKALIAALKSG
jgi:Putative peptidoglycan binding domain